MRFLCAGDLHLGAGSDLGREPGERLREQEAVLERIVSLANELDATLLWAGDAWERRRPTPEELLAFRRPLEAVHGDHGYGLARAGVAIHGNHDVEAFERATGYDAIQTGRHWHYVSRPKVLGLGEAQIACLPWAPPARLVALEEGGDRDEINRRLADGLLDIARGLFAETDASRPRILLAHWAVGGSETPTGVPAELFREPVIDANALAAIGFDAVVLGHIHKPQTIDVSGSFETRGVAFYVGSPMPLNFGEAGVDHGVYLLDVEAGSAAAYFVPIESRRLVTLEIDGADPRVSADVRDAIVKVRIRATPEQARRIDVAQMKDDLVSLGAHKVWAIQTEIEREEVVRGPAVDETISDEDALRLWLEASGVTISPIDGEPLPSLEAELLERHRVYLEEMNR